RSTATPEMHRAPIRAAHRHGVDVSYDLNFRDAVWRAFGGQARAIEVNRALVPLVDVLVGNEEDFSAALGFPVEGVDEQFAGLSAASFERMIRRVVAAFPNLHGVGATLRHARTATVNDWGAVCWIDGDVFEATPRE